MAETKKMLDLLLDEAGKQVLINASMVVDKASGKSMAAHIADNTLHKSADDIKSIITSETADMRTTLNNFLTGDPDDNGAMDRLRELVQAIEDNKTSIDDIIEASGTGIAFVTDADATPEYNGKLKLVVSDYATV